tara:strand:- start:840 stop:2081 length:1242 start_codon:yes stop_codon:yes gene_type:complete
MKDIQITIDSFKKFTGNIFMIDNMPELSIGGNSKGECEFDTELNFDTTLPSGTFDDPIDEWDVYLTSIFIGGYKMEQYAQPGCLFDNRQRWDGTGIDPQGPVSQSSTALGIIDLATDANGNSDDDYWNDVSGNLKQNAKNNNLATQSMLFTQNRTGAYMGIHAKTGQHGKGIARHPPGQTVGQAYFPNETIHAFVISIKDQHKDYMPINSFIGSYPKNYSDWRATRITDSPDIYPDGIKTFEWTSIHDDDVGSTSGQQGSPNNITGGLVLMNNQKQRNDGFESTGGATNQPEDKVVAKDASGSLTVQDYVPFIYDERENNPIYLTTLKSGNKISKLNVKIADQNGNSIWGPAHVSQIENMNGIDANPPTSSRRIIIKLSYKPKIKNKLIKAISMLNDNIEKLINNDKTTPSQF